MVSTQGVKTLTVLIIAGKKNRALAQPGRDETARDFAQSPPQPPELHEPELHPPPPSELADETEKPERIPASMKSTVIAPQVLNSSVSTRNCRELFSKT